MDVLSDAGIGLLIGWLLLGPVVLIAFSKVIGGRRKLLWASSAIAPVVLCVAAAVAMVWFRQSEFNIHSDFPPLFFGALFGTWIVYGLYKRQCVHTKAPNSTPHTDARAGGRER